MALECDPAHLGDIGVGKPEKEPQPDRVYEQVIEGRHQGEKTK